MSNLSFYEKAIALRERYDKEGDSDKSLILRKIVACAFEYNENLPESFYFSLPSDMYTRAFDNKVCDVLEDVGYDNSRVCHHGDSETTLFFVKQIDWIIDDFEKPLWKQRFFLLLLLFLHYHSSINVDNLPCYIWTFFWT